VFKLHEQQHKAVASTHSIRTIASYPLVVYEKSSEENERQTSQERLINSSVSIEPHHLRNMSSHFTKHPTNKLRIITATPQNKAHPRTERIKPSVHPKSIPNPVVQFSHFSLIRYRRSQPGSYCRSSQCAYHTRKEQSCRVFARVKEKRS
jgi:hypothetical protein